jgi:hypothetical protein
MAKGTVQKASSRKEPAQEIEPATQAELKTLNTEWEAGKLSGISGHLLEFIDRHRAEILTLSKNSYAPEDLLEATRQVVRQRGFIHLPTDMADQIREISNEIWYHGERGDFNRAKIQEEWTVKHAQTWRKWRVKEILYVVDRRASDVVASLLAKR